MELTLFEKSWLDVWEGAEPREPIGAIFTKAEVVSLILDLAGYSPARGRLADKRLLEPSCGDGAFLGEIIRRLVAAERATGGEIDWADALWEQAVTACDLNRGFIQLAREQAGRLLQAEGCPLRRARELAQTWLKHTDFLLTAWPEPFDFVAGNPPYVRIEDLPPRVLQRYRELYATCGDRADLYVAFFEKGLRLLSPAGCLAFICANRFAKNLYGRGLRQLIAQEYHVSYYLNLEHTQPFVTEVSAYPCITVIDRARGRPTRAATLQDVEPDTLKALRMDGRLGEAAQLATFPAWYPDGAAWVATERSDFEHLANLSAQFPLLEESARETKVGIGVATGADKIYVRKGLEAGIETECQLPLLMAADIQPQFLSWSEHYLINPFSEADDGSLRDLARYPGLAAFFARHSGVLLKRYIAGKHAEAWYRTIDRVSRSLTAKPKLVIPDIQAGGVVGLDPGRFYPHHNVYWITSEGWDLRVLQALLRSRIVLGQIRAFSVQMRGGSVRYQAQVLRQLRLPEAAAIPADLQARLAEVAAGDDQATINRLSQEAYGF